MTYDPTYGYPLKYVYTLSFDGETFYDYAERYLSDYVRVNDMSAIEAVEAESTEPTVYYNLQGIRVENPEPGTLYICRLGDKVRKVIGPVAP